MLSSTFIIFFVIFGLCIAGYFLDLFINVKTGNYDYPLFSGYVIVSKSMVPTININDVLFSGNNATGRGGAIYHYQASTVSIVDSEFEDNINADVANSIYLGASGNLYLENNVINTDFAEIYNNNGVITSQVNATILVLFVSTFLKFSTVILPSSFKGIYFNFIYKTI